MTLGVGSKPELGTGAVYRRVARNSGYLAAGTAASALFMMLTAVLNARTLSAHAFGLLVLFQSATMMVATLMSFSTQQPVIKLGAAALADGDTARLGRIIGLGLLFDVVASVTASAGAFAFLYFGRDWIGIGRDQVGVAALFAGSLLFTGYLTSNGILRLLDRFALLSLIQAACAAAVLAVTAFLRLFGATFEAYCWTWALFYAINSQIPLITSLYLARRSGIRVQISMNALGRNEVKTFFAYCWTTWGMATIEAIRSNGDSLLVGAAVSVEAAGIYNVAKQLAGVLRKLNTVYASAVFPEISALAAHSEHDSAVSIRHRMLRVGGTFGAAVVLGVVVVGHPVLGLLFGPHFEEAWLPLVLLSGAAAVQLIGHTLSIYIQVYVGPEALLRLYLWAAIPFVLSVVPLTWALSMTGTALAQLLFSIALIYFSHLTLRVANAT